MLTRIRNDNRDRNREVWMTKLTSDIETLPLFPHGIFDRKAKRSHRALFVTEPPGKWKSVVSSGRRPPRSPLTAIIGLISPSGRPSFVSRLCVHLDFNSRFLELIPKTHLNTEAGQSDFGRLFQYDSKLLHFSISKPLKLNEMRYEG
ncbi:hypothetical protein EVAR_28065_1 [Eumeta japonica]|uniref:Uncharacterized protein n=1 Tax=Eumeta variegata TaxID=151549 RepID=A0A4C1W8L6_EUMVA|nr:hypothetical protein EVAR_28065_1 [Eumeta japonica]